MKKFHAACALFAMAVAAYVAWQFSGDFDAARAPSLSKSQPAEPLPSLAQASSAAAGSAEGASIQESAGCPAAAMWFSKWEHLAAASAPPWHGAGLDWALPQSIAQAPGSFEYELIERAPGSEGAAGGVASKEDLVQMLGPLGEALAISKALSLIEASALDWKNAWRSCPADAILYSGKARLLSLVDSAAARVESGSIPYAMASEAFSSGSPSLIVNSFPPRMLKARLASMRSWLERLEQPNSGFETLSDSD